ncbi:hypothetical protein T08_11174 [Trichinella sp. T8]|nr:hypothetical protein T08_11174 [Trichinella sp. T8]
MKLLHSLVTIRNFTKIRNHVDKYVITKHYYQLMPLSLATYCFLDCLRLKRQIRNHVDKYIITKHYYQLMPLSLATYCFLDFSVNLSLKRQGSYGVQASISVKPQALPSGYAPGQIKICICLQAIPQAIYSTIFDLRGPRRCLRLCPRANKNLHIPAGYAQSILFAHSTLLLQSPKSCSPILRST